MKAKVLLAACAAALVLAACNANSPTAPSSRAPGVSVADGVQPFGSGGKTDTTTNGGH